MIVFYANYKAYVRSNAPFSVKITRVRAACRILKAQKKAECFEFLFLKGLIPKYSGDRGTLSFSVGIPFIEFIFMEIHQNYTGVLGMCFSIYIHN